MKRHIKIPKKSQTIIGTVFKEKICRALNLKEISLRANVTCELWQYSGHFNPGHLNTGLFIQVLVGHKCNGKVQVGPKGA